MNESNIFGLSIRGIIALIVVLSICAVCLVNRTDSNIGILKDLAIMILSFYFGQKSTQTGGSNVQIPNVSTAAVPAADSASKPAGQP